MRRHWSWRVTGWRQKKNLPMIAAAIKDNAVSPVSHSIARRSHERTGPKRSLEACKAAEGEGKACWLWAFDTSNGIERILSLLKTGEDVS